MPTHDIRITRILFMHILHPFLIFDRLHRVERWPKAFYSSRPGSTLDFTNVRLIFMNDLYIKCVSSILKYWRNCLITEENELINQPHSIVHPGLYCRWPRVTPEQRRQQKIFYDRHLSTTFPRSRQDRVVVFPRSYKHIETRTRISQCSLYYNTDVLPFYHLEW